MIIYHLNSHNMLRLNCMILSQNLNVGHVLLAVLQKHGKQKGPSKSHQPVILLICYGKLSQILCYSEFNLKSNNTFHTPKVLIVKVDVLWTLYGATDSLLHVFRGSRKRFMILGSIKRTKLIKIKESFLQKDEISITIIIFSNKTLDIKSSSYIRNPFDPNIVSPQSVDLKRCLFIIYLEKIQRTLCDQVDNNLVTLQLLQSISKVPYVIEHS